MNINQKQLHFHKCFSCLFFLEEITNNSIPMKLVLNEIKAEGLINKYWLISVILEQIIWK